MSSFRFQIFGACEKFNEYLKRAEKGKRIPEMPVVRWRGDIKSVTLPSDEFCILKDMYTEFLHKNISKPWESTKNFFKYIDLNVINIYFRGQHKEGDFKTEFFIDVVFSACAGQAETSAKLAAHWAGIWYEKNQDEIDNVLVSHGMKPNGKSEVQNNYGKFLPIGLFGYAIFNDYYDSELETYSTCKYFEIDQAAIEDLNNTIGLKSLASRLDKNYGLEMINGECKCQICCPHLNIIDVNRSLGIK